jgi:hypothetical protein
VQDVVLGTRSAPGLVDVLDANEPFAVVMPGVDETGDRGDQGTEMQRAGG